MSAKTAISSQIQMKNKKNQSMDQNTSPVPKLEVRVITEVSSDDAFLLTVAVSRAGR